MTRKINWDAVITAGVEYMDALNRYWKARIKAGFKRNECVFMQYHIGDEIAITYRSLHCAERTLYAMADLLNTSYPSIIAAARVINKYYERRDCSGNYINPEPLLDVMCD